MFLGKTDTVFAVAIMREVLSWGAGAVLETYGIFAWQPAAFPPY